MMIKANDPSRRSWIEVPSNSDFPIQNLPFGVFIPNDDIITTGTRIGDTAIDLSALHQLGFFKGMDLPDDIFLQDTLNEFIALGKETWRSVRNRLSDIFEKDNPELRDRKELHEQVLFPVSEVQMLMPVFVQDYTDFYSSREHATNVGTMFRDPKNALMPNWLHLPVGYHGRSSSIIISGIDVHRPKGQTLPPDATEPVFGPSKRVDFELEMAFVTTEGKPLGQSISTAEAEDYIFGMVIFNDWSARDIQKWEYVPLGPFLAKNFASSISPWIVTLDALEPFRTAGPKQEPQVLDYLKYQGDKNFDIDLEVYLQPEGGEENLICRSNHKYLYWNIFQQLAHHTVNGCNINSGDMMASGTISGPDKSSYGSMLELAWSGKEPITLSDGSKRSFIEDGDTVIMRAYKEKNGVRIGFGEVSSKLLPAL
ncbi:MAG: fumarylacetoacetase [Bacteroidota bacterium]|nr:fumarylacetoacetase [Bacteroidota bacterium]